MPALCRLYRGGARRHWISVAAGAVGEGRKIMDQIEGFRRLSRRRRGGAARYSIRPKRRRSCSSASCPMRSRSTSRTPGRSASPACSPRPARPQPPPPGTRAVPTGATTRSVSPTIIGSDLNQTISSASTAPGSSDVAAAVAAAAAARRAAVAAVAVARAGERGYCNSCARNVMRDGLCSMLRASRSAL